MQHGENIAFVGRRAQRRLPGVDWGYEERQRFLHPPELVVLTQEEFGYWLAVFFVAGACLGILLAAMCGWKI